MTIKTSKNYDELALERHKKSKGKIAIQSRMPLETQDDLSIAYTPGIAAPCRAIAKDRRKSYEYTSKGNMVAVISDGSAVLGLGNIGPEASLPVMEGKAVLFKKFADIDAIPIVLDTQNTEEIIATVKAIAPTFGGINLEDISAPRCFEIEQRLKDICDIPVMHDDQHGTAIVTMAGMLNALKLTGRSLHDLKVVISGAGSAGVAIVDLLKEIGGCQIIVCDSKGAIYEGRNGLNSVKKKLAAKTNATKQQGKLQDVIKDSDIFIGVSAPGILSTSMVKSMNKDPIIFAMANPDPEINPNEALEAGAAVVATGRSDYPNQINNVLAFPGIFRGALNARADGLNKEVYLAAAHAIADCVTKPSADNIIPNPFDKEVAPAVSKAVFEVLTKMSDKK